MGCRNKIVLIVSILLLISCGTLTALFMLITGEPRSDRIKEASTSPDGQYTALASVKVPLGGSEEDGEFFSSELYYSLRLRRNLGKSPGEEADLFYYADSGNFKPKFKFTWQDSRNLLVDYQNVGPREKSQDVGDVHIQYREIPR